MTHHLLEGGVESAHAALGVEDTTDNDFLLAQMLQYEFDVQHDQQIELNQRQMNKNSKCECVVTLYVTFMIYVN